MFFSYDTGLVWWGVESTAQDMVPEGVSVTPFLSCTRAMRSRLLGQWSWLAVWKPQGHAESEHSEQHPAQARSLGSRKTLLQMLPCGVSSVDKYRAPRKRLPLVSLPHGGQPVLGCDVPTAAQKGALPEVERPQVHREARLLLLFLWGLDSQAGSGHIVSPRESLGLSSPELPLGTAVPAPCWGVRRVLGESRGEDMDAGPGCLTLPLGGSALCSFPVISHCMSPGKWWDLEVLVGTPQHR